MEYFKAWKALRDVFHVELEQIELPAKLLDYFLRSNKSNINQTEQINAHATLFLHLHKKLAAPYRNRIAKFKIRSRPMERGHPRYQSRPESVPLSVANSQKKGKIPKHVTLFLNLQKILGAPYRNATAKFKIQSGLLERGHPRYQCRPESVTLSVANSRTKMKSPHIVHPKAC